MILGYAILICLCTLTIFSLLFQVQWLLVVVSFVAIIYLLFLLSDLFLLKKTLQAKLIDLDRSQYAGSKQLFTTIADQLSHCFVVASQKLAFLQDQILSDYYKQAVSITEQTEPDYTTILVKDPLLIQLDKVAKTQQAMLAVFLIYNKKDRTLQSLVNDDASNARLAAQLKLKYLPYFETADLNQIGLFDSQAAVDLTSNFLSFGVRFYTAVSATDTASDWLGLLWLGYASNCYPDLNRRNDIVVTARQLLNMYVTSQKVATLSEQVNQAKEQKQTTEQFVAHLSHDLRAPLHNVKTVLGIVGDQQIEDNEKQELLQVATRNCDTLEELITDILDYNRHSIGQLKCQPELVDLAQLIKSVKNNYVFTARRKGLEFKYQGPKQGLFAKVDRRQLSRVIANLIGNAIKYTSQGYVKVELLQKDAIYIIKVSDSGCGITADKQTEIFEPFRRNNDSVAGVGLGLTVCKILTELNSGALSVFSDGQSGSTFTISLPAAKSKEVTDYNVLSIKTEQVPVLLFTENHSFLAEWSTKLTKDSFTIHAANSFPDALALLSYAEPKVAVVIENDSEKIKIIVQTMTSKSPITLLILTDQNCTELAANTKHSVKVRYMSISSDLEQIEQAVHAMVARDHSMSTAVVGY